MTLMRCPKCGTRYDTQPFAPGSELVRLLDPHLSEVAPQIPHGLRHKDNIFCAVPTCLTTLELDATEARPE